MKKYTLILMFVMINSMAQTPLGSEFTYQGELKDNLGNPLSGQYDFKFVAFDAQDDGMGTNLATNTVEDVQVTDGIFTTQLDLGSSTFIGDKIWLEINVRNGASTGGFTQLLPRQQVTATPYATHAQFVGANAISDLEIQDGSVTAADLAANSVGKSEIAANAVGTSEIIATQVQRRVTGSCSAGDFITAVAEDGTVTCVTQDTGLTSVTSAEIVDGTIQTIDLANSSITSAKIAANAVGASDINDNEVQARITGTCLAGFVMNGVDNDGSVFCVADASGITSVTSADIVDATIQTVDLSNGSVNIGKLAANSVDSSKIVDNSITSTDLAVNSVGTSEIITTQVQRRVTGSCDLGYYLNGINQDGSVNCTRLPVSLDSIANSAGTVGQYTNIAIGSDNYPIISYYDSTNSDLKVYKCSNSACSAGIAYTLDSVGGVGNYTSIAIGSDNNPIISYYDSTNSDLKVYKCDNISCSGGTGTASTLDSTGNVGQYTSIAIGSDDNPIISYYDNTNGDLKAYKCDNISCSGGTGTATTLVSGNTTGLYTSIAIGSGNNPIITYYNDSFNDLYLYSCSNISCSSGFGYSIDLVGSIGYSSIAIGFDNKPIFSYYDSGDLKVWHCDDTICNIGGTGSTLDSTGSVGQYTSITIGSDNNPTISYYDSTNGDLKVYKCSNYSCSGGNAFTLDSAGSIGKFSSIAIGSDNNPIISYYDDTNGDLKVYSCADTDCRR